jgi:AcrR family transcriptional regulator
MVHTTNVPTGTQPDKARQQVSRPAPEALLDRCLAAFIDAGTLDLSLDHLAAAVGTSKRMLIHYFGTRQDLEERAMARLEDQLRAQFTPSAFSPDATARDVVLALWDQTTAPRTRGILLLVMDVSRRAWMGSKRARAFYREQQRLWVELLRPFFRDSAAVEDVLQGFQGAVLAYLITGDRESGRRALVRLVKGPSKKTAGS